MANIAKKPVKRVADNNHVMTLPNFVKLVDRYQKAVVGIEVVHEQPSQRILGFGAPWERRVNPPMQRTLNIGTGFIFDEHGYILTNEHVVHGASQVFVRVIGRKNRIRATVVETDYTHDIAILQADVPVPQYVLRIGRSKTVHVGEWVLAIGSPLGLDHTVTVGIVSAKDRPMQIGDRDYPSLLQTDAAINRGNSGGPLINVRGEVIGMNTAVSQSSQGIGFAISADVLRNKMVKYIR